jgi:hypothetical protein
MYDETTVPTTIYASKVIGCTELAWENVRFPLDVESPEADLTISERKQLSEGLVGFPDEARQATLRFGRLRAPLGVVVEMTRWTDRTVEIGIRPPRHLPFWVSGDRYVRAAYAVLDRLARTLSAHAGDALLDLEQLEQSA